jgi:prepilin-type N-terminal cleavage/methylation domain-containing protein
MKKLSTLKTQKGFTLIELLIAITIVAILSVIGFTIFQNIQRGARDSVRRIEVDSLAKNIESSYDAATRRYTYSQAQYDGDFPGIKPRDPLNNGTDLREYCVAIGNTVPADPAAGAWAANALCPAAPWTNFSTKATSPVTADNLVVTAGNSPVASTVAWKICTKLEANTGFYCKQSLQNQ